MQFEQRTLGQSMLRLFMGYIPTRVIYAAAKLELTDHIGDDGATAQELAHKIKSIPQPCSASCACLLALAYCTKMLLTGST